MTSNIGSQYLLEGITSQGEITEEARTAVMDALRSHFRPEFQQRFGISPAKGQADATTADVARRITASLTAAEQAKCGAGAGVTACVDLALQTVWVVRDDAVVFGRR